MKKSNSRGENAPPVSRKWRISTGPKCGYGLDYYFKEDSQSLGKFYRSVEKRKFRKPLALVTNLKEVDGEAMVRV